MERFSTMHLTGKQHYEFPLHYIEKNPAGFHFYVVLDAIGFFSLLLIRNTIPYFSFSQNISFIQEKAVLFLRPFYRTCFYLHIFAGMFCIGAALLQFSSEILKKRKAIHILGGRIYVMMVLLLGAPTGLYMSFFAKGGFTERGCLCSWPYAPSAKRIIKN